MADAPANRIRERREALGLTQGALAERAAVTRQSIHAIETGRAVPGVDVALGIARALDTRVEELFGAAAAALLDTTPAPSPAGAHALTERVAVARVGGRWISHALAGDGARTAADALVTLRSPGRAQVEPLRPPAELAENVLLMGCATALGVLADRLSARTGPGHFRWLPASSAAALASLGEGAVHVAGTHLTEAARGEANVAAVRRTEPSVPLVLVTFARWEAGLLTRPDAARRIRGVADLGRRGLRLVTREQGAGARRLLERELAAAGLPLSLAARSPLVAAGHLEVARAIAMGAADAGIATRDVALSHGLRFVPLAEERYDLVLPTASLGDARIARLFDVLTSSPFRRELTALGYDSGPAGERVAEVKAA